MKSKTWAVPLSALLPLVACGPHVSGATIDFVVGLNGESFDLWIDDLALLCRGVCQVHSP